ncbi:MAG: hypothetical protein KatS3mg077_0025 [Candidatus Binatia bacterium]|nr:MAG: hypothetical protein KatS3mg077_0025 [Candidatus Binatia bacterium]
MNVRVLAYRAACGLFVCAAAGAYAVANAPLGKQAAVGIGLHFMLTALMLVAWAAGRSREADDARWALFAGVLARLLVAPLAVAGNADVQRYLWDGAVLAAGLDPYRVAPAQAELASLRAAWPVFPPHASYPTLYPPGAVVLFALAAGFGPRWAPWVWKALIASASLGILWFGARTLQAAGRSRHLPLLALSPLLVLETAFGAHLDMVSAFALSVALYLAVRGKALGSGIALGLGALVKLLPILAVVAFAPRFARSGVRRLVAASGSVVAIGYLLAFLFRLRPWGSLGVFFERWRFGSPLFAAVSATWGEAGGSVAALLVGGVVLCVAVVRARWDWKEAVPLVLAAPLLASPVVFRWYLVPLVPAMALAPQAWVLAWITALPLADEAMDRAHLTGLWEPASWPLWAIAVAWCIGLTVDVARRRGRRSPRLEVAGRRPRVSVIVPVYNEASRIAQHLELLRAQEEFHQVIVVEGGSTDATPMVLQGVAGVQLVEAPRGRAVQMNEGAKYATGDVLLFLHADARLPAGATSWIAEALSEPDVVGGAFRIWTVTEGRRSWLAPLLHIADLRSRYTSLPYGDQALFVRPDVFRQLGGFPELPILEDLEFSRRLREVGRIRIVPASVIVSGRRFLAGPLYYAVLMKLIPLLYRLGISPQALARVYGHPR